jgi:hypothetical protein
MLDPEFELWLQGEDICGHHGYPCCYCLACEPWIEFGIEDEPYWAHDSYACDCHGPACCWCFICAPYGYRSDEQDFAPPALRWDQIDTRLDPVWTIGDTMTPEKWKRLRRFLREGRAA